jgi:TPP-dependent pyruvate/acetoin dehydrogenase alpha subunit
MADGQRGGRSAALDAIQEALIKEMDAAVEFAVGSPYPDPDKVDQDIYA